MAGTEAIMEDDVAQILPFSLNSLGDKNRTYLHIFIISPTSSLGSEKG